MNGSTSGNSPHGLNKAEVNAFSYWQYVDLLVYWGGSSGEGLIVAPSADVDGVLFRQGVLPVHLSFRRHGIVINQLQLRCLWSARPLRVFPL